MSEKVELVIQKNGKPVRKALSVSPKITFESFHTKLTRYTGKGFRLEYFSNNHWQQLNETNLRPLLKNYKGHIINLLTDESADNSQISMKSQVLPSSAMPSQTDKEESSMLEQALSAEIKATLKADFPDSKSEFGQAKPETPFQDAVKDIVSAIVDVAQKQMHKRYKVVRDNEQVIDLGKTCSECGSRAFKGPYYLCLICTQEFILCPECEAKEIISDKQLKNHKFKSHPFAKIKRTAQTIKSKNVKTISEKDINFQEREKERVITARPKMETQEDITNFLREKFQHMYKQLIEKSYYYRSAYNNPQNIQLKKSTFHTNNAADYTEHAQAQVVSGTIQSDFATNFSQKSSTQSEMGWPLTEKQKLQKVKKLKRFVGITEEQVKQYTTGKFENMRYSQVIEIMRKQIK